MNNKNASRQIERGCSTDEIDIRVTIKYQEPIANPAQVAQQAVNAARKAFLAALQAGLFDERDSEGFVDTVTVKAGDVQLVIDVAELPPDLPIPAYFAAMFRGLENL